MRPRAKSLIEGPLVGSIAEGVTVEFHGLLLEVLGGSSLPVLSTRQPSGTFRVRASASGARRSDTSAVPAFRATAVVLAGA